MSIVIYGLHGHCVRKLCILYQWLNVVKIAWYNAFNLRTSHYFVNILAFHLIEIS